jgi:hypothetical protein
VKIVIPLHFQDGYHKGHHMRTEMKRELLRRLGDDKSPENIRRCVLDMTPEADEHLIAYIQEVVNV